MINLIKKYKETTNEKRMKFIDIDDSSLEMTFTDDLYPKQWYLVSYFILKIINVK
jgi:hypothetical protein